MYSASYLPNYYWSRHRRLTAHEVRSAIVFWAALLGVRQSIATERISRFQVTNEFGQPGTGLVGVVHNESNATIYHTRALVGEDLIHELLHVARPDWTEQQVVGETARLVSLLAQRNRQASPILRDLQLAPAS
jgi:hypothetical protein